MLRTILPALLIALPLAPPVHAGTSSPDGTYAGYLGPAGRLYAPDLEGRADAPASCLAILRSTDGHARLVRVDLAADTTVVWPVPGRDPISGVYDAASDGAGGFYVTWLDYRMGSNHWGRVYAQRIAASGAVAAGWPDSGLPVGLPDVQSDHPRIVRTGDGGAMVAWDEIHGGPVEVVARAVSAGGVPGGAEPLVVLLSPGAQRLAALAAHPFGGVVLALEDTRNNDTDVLAQRIGSALERVWGDAGSVVARTAQWQGAPVLLPVADGSVYFGWEDAREGAWNDPRTDIYATRLTSGGAPASGFVLHGKLVRAGAGRGDVHLVGDGAGGVYVSSIAPSEARIDRLAADGIVDDGWTSFAPPVAFTGLVNHGHPSDAITDGEGGLFFAWSSGGVASVQRLTPGGIGAAGWPEGGRVFDGGGSGGIGRVSLVSGELPGTAWLAYESTAPLPCSPGEVCYEKRAWVVRMPEASVGVPGPPRALALDLSGALPNPVVAGQEFRVVFALPAEGAARLTVVDVAGRVRLRHTWTSLAAGPHTLALTGAQALVPGVYLLRVTQDGLAATSRVIVVR